MNTLLYSGNLILAESIFDKTDSLAGDAKTTVLAVFAAGFFIGALVTWAKAGFSVKSGIVSLIMVAIGLAILGQIDGIKQMFSDTVSTSSATSTHQVVTVASDDLEGPVTIVVATRV